MRRQIFLSGRGGIDNNNATQSVDLTLRTIDVSAKDYLYKYVIEQSYTYMDAMFFRQYLNYKDEKEKEQKVLKVFKKMSTDHIQRLVHNIFPRDDELFSFT